MILPVQMSSFLCSFSFSRSTVIHLHAFFISHLVMTFNCQVYISRGIIKINIDETVHQERLCSGAILAR